MITESRNKMTFERLKYYRHLGGGALECIASRLSKTPKPLCFSLMVTSKCNCDCDFCFWKHKKGTDDMPKEEIIHRLNDALPKDIRVYDVTEPQMKPGKIAYADYERWN